jgi:hypothetical protein
VEHLDGRARLRLGRTRPDGDDLPARPVHRTGDDDRAGLGRERAGRVDQDSERIRDPERPVLLDGSGPGRHLVDQLLGDGGAARNVAPGVDGSVGAEREPGRTGRGRVGGDDEAGNDRLRSGRPGGEQHEDGERRGGGAHDP